MAIGTYFQILNLATDPLALQVGIVCSDLFPEEVKEQARHATTLEALRQLVAEQKARVGTP